MIPIIGPKRSMLLMGVPAVGGWILLLIGKPLDEYIDPIWLFYVGRVLTGVGGGAYALAAPLYVSETAEVRIRGALGSLQQFQVSLGVVYINALSINNAVDWVSITGTCIAFPGDFSMNSFIGF